MKIHFLKPLLFILTALLACGEDDAKPANGSPQWSADFPKIAHGAISVDINIQTDKDAKIYWLISNTPHSYKASELKTLALGAKSPDVKFNGIIDSKANEKKLETVDGLTQNTKYFVFLVAQNKGDTVLQDEVKVFEFKTHIRQDTLEYTSTEENRQVKYLLYRPEEVLKYPELTYPIIFFLGGNGEVASDSKPINMIRNGSLPEYIHKGNDVPMMVMSIQHTKLNWNATLIDEGVNHAFATYPVDAGKVYMTGISGGGFGCWNYAVSHADKLTAIVPISGGGNTSKACNLKDIHIWAFHNAKDGIVNSENTDNMISAVKACSPNKEVKKLIFPDEGHDCWRRVYDDEHGNWGKSPDVAKFDIYEWLLSKSK